MGGKERKEHRGRMPVQLTEQGNTYVCANPCIYMYINTFICNFILNAMSSYGFSSNSLPYELC